MDELALDVSRILPWFGHEQDSPYVLIRIAGQHVAGWVSSLGVPVRQCYIADDLLKLNANRTGRSKAEILAAKIPDRGSTMSGDFGEILVYLYHAAQEHPAAIIGPKKWRLKQDRTKPAPYSDVIHFVVPLWPQASDEDKVLCSEVKTKRNMSMELRHQDVEFSVAR